MRNKMRYIELKESLKEFTVFSLSDIKRIDSNFHRRRLNDWQNKGYIRKIIKGYYVFSDIPLNENILFEIANRIYNPSYVSLETALSYYNLIPESVYTITSVSTRRTYHFVTPLGEFYYHSVKPDVFTGYNLVKYKNKYFKIASIEKTILDFFYLHSSLKTVTDFLSLRINRDLFLERINEVKLLRLLDKFRQKTLAKKIKDFLQFMKNA